MRVPNDVKEEIIKALAEIRAILEEAILDEINDKGLDEIMLSSHEVVTVLVLLEDQTGIDPTDPDVLKDCDLQSLGQLITFIDTNMEA